MEATELNELALKLADEFKVPVEEVHEAFASATDILDVRAYLADKQIQKAAEKLPILTGAKKTTVSMISVPLYVSHAPATKAGGETVEILGGTFPEDSPLSGKRVSCMPKEFFGIAPNPEKQPELAVYIREPFDPSNRPENGRTPSYRCGGIWARQSRDGDNFLAGSLTDPIDGSYKLPDGLHGSRLRLRQNQGSEPGKFTLEITPQTVAESRLDRWFGKPKAPTAAEVELAAVVAENGEPIPF